MTAFFNYLSEFNFASVALRLTLAMFFGGMIGLERAQKRRAAGFRTYMIVCLGAALAVLLSQYEYQMLLGPWAEAAAAASNANIDASVIGAEVVGGVGFLATGTIMITGHQEVKGLTTAAGLWASACTGLALGAGFYVCVIFSYALIYLSFKLLPPIEAFIVHRAKNINVYIEFLYINDIGAIIARFREMGTEIYDVEITRGNIVNEFRPSAVFYVRLPESRRHEEVLAAISEFRHVTMVDEI